MQIKPEETKKETDGKMPANRIVRYRIACALFAFLLAAVAMHTVMGVRSANDRIAGQEAELKELEDALAAKGGPKTDDEKAGDNAAITGSTKESPDPGAAFLKKFLTWDSEDDYKAIRKWLKESCGSAKGDSVLSDFMPKIAEGDFNDANMRFVSADTYVLEEDGGMQRCFAVCKVTNRINGSEGNGKVLVRYTVSEGDRKSVV